MANTKHIRIEGILPFDCDRNPDVKGWLSSMNLPAFGLRIKWGVNPWMVPNEHGGQTTMYHFSIEGTEAVSYDAIDGLVKAIADVGGRVDNKWIKDLDYAGWRKEPRLMS